MTERDAVRRGLLCNGLIALSELILTGMIAYMKGADAAFSYGYGALTGIVLSTIFYLVAWRIRMFGTAVFLPVFGGFFMRMGLLVLALAAVHRVCDMVWLVAGIIPSILITIGMEIFFFARVDEFE